ncbi:FtsX-like permease family protein [Paenisporosarcina cavernae]|uniref:Putative hemin transport system permease protein HrtB n=1 Tax=Paenisporosarcina cavernae TaxID=2320858 RepID=A0A385YPN6_9BACL|nr:ABC transporter permease [Paenisporosarcina cavernae]AYC28474.1 ABC transporter permease [Paenisporosarcina cavernae]
MKLAWKEMKKGKSKFIILGSIIFLVSFLTLVISGLANGLSYDSAGLIKNLPSGQYYLSKEAEGNSAMSAIPSDMANEFMKENEEAMALSIQMGYVTTTADQQESVAFVTSTPFKHFPSVRAGEIVLDASLKEQGVHIGDTVVNEWSKKEFVVKDFVEGQTYSHTAVAFVNERDFAALFGKSERQMMFLPGDEAVAFSKELDVYSTSQFLQTIASYQSEQLSLNMIIGFLVVISGMLFGIFFYMMNVQKLSLYGILKAIGVKTSTLFTLIWTQMILTTTAALFLSILLSQLVSFMKPESLPYQLSLSTTLLLVGLFFLVGFLGATISGWQVKNVQPLQAIQQGEV